MKVLFIIIVLLSITAFSQTITSIDSDQVKIENNGYQYLEGNSYYFKSNNQIVKMTARSTESDISFFTVTKGKEHISKGQKLTKLKKKSETQMLSRMQHPPEMPFRKLRFSFGLSSQMMSDLKGNVPSDPAFDGKSFAEAFNSFGLNMEFRYLLKKFLHIGAAFRAGFTGDVQLNEFDSNGNLALTLSADGSLFGMDFFIGPEYKGLYATIGYSFSSVQAKLINSVSVLGGGLNFGLGYEYFFGPKWGVNLTGKYVKFSGDERVTEDTSGNRTRAKFIDGSLDTNIIAIGINAVMRM